MPVTWSDEKLILLYCPGRVRTHDLPHTVSSNPDRGNIVVLLYTNNNIELTSNIIKSINNNVVSCIVQSV